MSTRGVSTATLEKRAELAAREAERAEIARIKSDAGADDDGEEDITSTTITAGTSTTIQDDDPTDAHLDTLLPLEDEKEVETKYTASLQTMSELESRMSDAVSLAQKQLISSQTMFSEQLEKHVEKMKKRGMDSALSERLKKRLQETAKEMSQMEKEVSENITIVSPPPLAATTSKFITTSSTSKVRPKLSDGTKGIKATPTTRTSTTASTSTATKSQFARTGPIVSFSDAMASARSHVDYPVEPSSPDAFSTPISSRPTTSASSLHNRPAFISSTLEDRPSTARPASASKRSGTNTPRQRLEQAKLFSESVYSGKVNDSGSSEFDDATLPPALAKLRASSAPQRPQYSKPSFIQPAQPMLAPILKPAAPASSSTAKEASRPSSAASHSSDISDTPSTKSNSSSSSILSSASKVLKKKKANVAGSVTSSTPSSTSTTSSSSSSLFASPFSHLKSVPVMTIHEAASVAAKESKVRLKNNTTTKETAAVLETTPSTPATKVKSKEKEKGKDDKPLTEILAEVMSTKTATTPRSTAAAAATSLTTDPSDPSSPSLAEDPDSAAARLAAASKRNQSIIAATKAALAAASSKSPAAPSSSIPQPPETTSITTTTKPSPFVTSTPQFSPPPPPSINLHTTRPVNVVTPNVKPSKYSLAQPKLTKQEKLEKQQQEKQQQQQPSLVVSGMKTSPSMTSLGATNSTLTKSTSSKALNAATSQPLLVQAQQVRQQLNATQELEVDDADAAGAEADEQTSNGSHPSNGDANDNDDDEPEPSLFARPWSHASRHSSRPSSAARTRPDSITAQQSDRIYSSFSMPIDLTLATKLHDQIHISETYAKAFAVASSVTNQQQQKSTMQNSQSMKQFTPTTNVLRTGNTPRGTLPIAHNPFLFKTNAFSAQR